MFSHRLRRPVARLQSGQVLILAMGLLIVGAFMLMRVWSAGQVTLTKQRLVDTADAAAWSAALWRARVLNYHAYSNRAIIANEVAIAQAVTLLSWAQYFETLMQNASAVGSMLPSIQPALQGAAQAARLARESAQWAAQLEVPARGAETLGYKAILQASQEVLQRSTQSFGINMVTAEISRATDPRFFAWVLPDLSSSWSRFTERSTSLAGRHRLAQLVRASLDPFTMGPRNDDIHTPIPSTCLNLQRLRKRGGTALSADLQRWEAIDTVSFHHRYLRFFKCRESESLPLGWGAAATAPPKRPVSSQVGDVEINPAARLRANTSLIHLNHYAGITASRELAYSQLSDPLFPSSELAVVARVEGRRVSTVMQKGWASGRLMPPDMFSGGVAGHMWALAAAQVYFRRPPQAAVRTEYASLFNPYWQVRLIAPSNAQHAAAKAAIHVQ